MQDYFPKFPTISQLAAEETAPKLQLAPYSFLRFPNLFELASAEETAEAKRPKGLFEELLGGRSDILFQDAQQHRDRYDETTLALLQDLVTGKRRREELTKEEREMLDQAVCDFASYVPPKETKRTPKIEVRQSALKTEAPEHADIDIPAGTPNAYWWL